MSPETYQWIITYYKFVRTWCIFKVCSVREQEDCHTPADVSTFKPRLKFTERQVIFCCCLELTAAWTLGGNLKASLFWWLTASQLSEQLCPPFFFFVSFAAHWELRVKKLLFNSRVSLCHLFNELLVIQCLAYSIRMIVATAYKGTG